MADHASVDVPARGKCVTRNGTYTISRMTASEEGGRTELGFVSGRLKRSLHSGATIDARDLDDFCRGWLKSRGHTLDADVAQEAFEHLHEAEKSIGEAIKLLDK